MTIEDQIKCVSREINMRRRVYPRLVRDDKMSPEESIWELRAMEAVLETLRGIADKDQMSLFP